MWIQSVTQSERQTGASGGGGEGTFLFPPPQPPTQTQISEERERCRKDRKGFAFHGAPERRTDEEEWGGEERDGVGGSERLDERRQRSADRLMENAPPPSISLMTVAKEKGAGNLSCRYRSDVRCTCCNEIEAALRPTTDRKEK